MAKNKTPLELTWTGKENRPARTGHADRSQLDWRILIEDTAKSYDAARGVSENDFFDNGGFFRDNPGAQSVQAKLTRQKQIRDLERRCHIKRRELFDAQGAIDRQREGLIGKIEKQLKHTSIVQTLFTIRWRIR